MAREANRDTMITVTRADLNDAGTDATIYITVFPEKGEAGALAFANRNRKELGHFLLQRTRGMRLPHMEFVIDQGDKHRRRLEELSN